MQVDIKKLKNGAVIPTYGSEFSAGADLRACLESDVKVDSKQTVLIPTGLAMAIPVGYVGLIYARSGLATKCGLAPANKVGVIDADYRGEVMVALYNHSGESQLIKNGDRIAQLVIAPFLTADFKVVGELNETKRGSGGFGSTGKN